MAWAVDTNILKHFTQPGTSEHAQCTQAVRSLWMRGERPATFAQCAVEFFGFLTRPSLADDSTLSNPGLGLSVAKAELELRTVEGLFGIQRDTPVLYHAGSL